MSIFSRHCFQFKFSISGRLSPYGFINITFITISSTHRTLLPHNIQNCNSNYFLKSNKLTFKYIFRCSFKTYTVSVKNSWVRPPASTPDKRASHILTCFAKLMDSVKKKTKKKQNRSMSLCIFRYFLYFSCCFLFNMSLWLKYLRQNTKKHCSILVLCRRVWQLYFLAFQLLAEADLGLLQNPRWKALHLGCSNSPRSVSDWIYIFMWLSYLRIIFRETSTAKNTVISPNFLVWNICGKAHFPHSFGRIAETMRKLCLSTKFPHQEMKWSYGIFSSVGNLMECQ